jgi:hypothetical protein
VCQGMICVSVDRSALFEPGAKRSPGTFGQFRPEGLAPGAVDRRQRRGPSSLGVDLGSHRGSIEDRCGIDGGLTWGRADLPPRLPVPSRPRRASLCLLPSPATVCSDGRAGPPLRPPTCYLVDVPFEADVLVMARDVPDVRLVAEVKRNIGNVGDAEAQLRQYMLARRCSLGLLVTPEHTRIYRDTFADFTEGSVQLVGEFSTAELLDMDEAPADEHALQEAVREWLDRMAASWPSALPRTDAARAPVVQYLVPEVADGRVSSGSLG